MAPSPTPSPPPLVCSLQPLPLHSALKNLPPRSPRTNRRTPQDPTAALPKNQPPCSPRTNRHAPQEPTAALPKNQPPCSPRPDRRTYQRPCLHLDAANERGALPAGGADHSRLTAAAEL
eukprot:356623-Chlamydomonas_euryale.AAC.4